MSTRRILALGTAMLLTFAIIFCVPSAFVSASHAECTDSSPLSLTSSSVAVMYFLPVYERDLSFEPMRRSVLQAPENTGCEGYVPACFTEGTVFKPACKDLFTAESICPRAP